MQKKYDIAVVGGGPAGCTAAKIIAEKGLKVILIEKESFGRVTSCGEFVPKLIRNETRLEGCVANATEKIVTHLPDGITIETTAPGYILDRMKFNQLLQNSALNAGANVFFKTVCAGLKDCNLIIVKNLETCRKMQITAEILIAADGATSTLRQILSTHPEYCVALQCEIKTAPMVEEAHIFFNPMWYGGYGWLFPKEQTANIGVGVRQGKTSANCIFYLKQLIKILNQKFQLNVSNACIESKQKGLIPVSVLQKCTYRNIIFAGDAACHTNPITGAGILQAIVGGRLAAETAIKAFETADLCNLSEYDEKWNDYFGHTLAVADAKRKYLETHWCTDVKKLTQVLKKCWVVFDEYYKS